VKLIRSDKRQFTFSIAPTEKQMLFQLLKLYPLVPPAHHQLSKTAEGPAHDENQRLLEESLAEQRRENRKQALAMLEKPGRFREAEDGLRFSLKPSEMNWLLQVLNDVRVGAWLALGEPEEFDFPEINQANEPYPMAMEGAGYFETHLLDALGVKNPEGFELG
jgi:hypothetical protein